jgi:hypothetical protein
MVRFKLTEPLAAFAWYVVVIANFLASIPICLVRSAAKKQLILPQLLGWKRPHLSLIGENSLVEFRKALEIAKNVKEELRPSVEEERTRLQELKTWATLSPIVLGAIITDDFFKITKEGGFFPSWENIGRLALVPIQALIRLGEVIGGVVTRAGVETLICIGLYTLWYFDAHPNTALDLAVKIGLWQVIIQALHYSGWQFVNRTLEPIVVGISAEGMVKFRATLGKVLVQLIKASADQAVKITEYLTTEENQVEPTPIPLLAPAEDPSDKQTDAEKNLLTSDTNPTEEVPELEEVPGDATDQPS